jgi:hypothetical protein
MPYVSRADKTVRLQLKNVRVDVPISEWVGLMSGTGSQPTLDHLFPALPEGSKKVRVALWRHPDQLNVLVRLKARYGHSYDCFLDGDVERSISTLNSLSTIRGPHDVAVYRPDEKAFGTKDFGVIDNIDDVLKEAGVSPNFGIQPVEQANVLVITVHNEEKSRRYMDALGRAGSLRGKDLLLLTCFLEGNEEFIRHLIYEYGAKSVTSYATKIRPVAVEQALRHFFQALKSNTGEEWLLHDLFEESVSEALKDPNITDENVRLWLTELKQNAPQISALKCKDINRAREEIESRGRFISSSRVRKHRNAEE